jgi:hypothetical protein
MSCPPGESIARLIAEDLPLAEARELEQHLASCERCGHRQQQTEQLVRRLAEPAAQDDAAAFVARTMGRLDRGPRRARLSWPGLAAAALLLLALPVSYLLINRPDRGTFTARGARPAGAPSLERVTGLDPLVVRAARQRPLIRGMLLRPADGLAFRYTNLSRERLYLMALALDRRGEVHWFYPAYLSEQSDPRAVPLEPGTRGRLLPEVTQPEDVPPGALRVVTVVSRRRASVKQVERRLAGHGPGRSVAPLFAGDAVQEWLVQMRSTPEEDHAR